MEYYTVEKKNNLGEQYIELSVFQAITNHEVSKINGIDFDGGKNSVNIEINDHNQVIIGIDIVIDYGLNVGKVVSEIQNEVVNAIDRYIGFRNVRKKLIREKAVIAVYQYLLTNSTEEEIMNYLNECYKPRMDEREIELCKEIAFNTIERIDEYVPLIEKNLKKSWSIDRLSMMEKAILYVAIYERNEVSKEISINQAVELAKKYCDEDAYKFINGVLGAIG